MFSYNLQKERQPLRKLKNDVYFTKKNEEPRYIGRCSKMIDVYTITYSYNYVNMVLTRSANKNFIRLIRKKFKNNA